METLSPSPPPPPPPPLFFPFPEPSSTVSFGSGGRDGFENRRTSYDINNNIMLTAIISLSFVVVLVIALHIYARYALRRNQSRRRGLFSISVSASANASSGEPPKTGLDPGVIASLPMFLHKQIDGDTSIECAVCLSVLEDQEMARLLPNCKHTFHAECIDKWLTSRTTCPICRAEAQPQLLQPEPREGLARAAPILLVGVDSTSACIEGTASSDAETNPSSKVTGSTSRLSSFRRILSRERSSRRLHPEAQEQGFEDLERQ